MTSFASTSWRFLQRLITGSSDAAPTPAGEPIVLDGLSAVALVEAAISETAGLGATFPATVGARLFGRHAVHGQHNEFGAPLEAIETHSPRAALASAIGLAMAGQRATAFLSGPDALASADLLRTASGQHVPLVVHLACRAASGHAQAIGTGHESLASVRDSGCFLLHAMNVQEAIDLALIARYVSERMLIPGIVAMDCEQTALAAQDVVVPDADSMRAFIGDPSHMIPPSTEAQRMIFGESRRLVPRAFSVDRACMLAPLQGPEAFALGVAGHRVFFADDVPTCLTEAKVGYAERTDRSCEPLLAHRTKGAAIVLIAQGSAVETLCAFADHVSERRKTSLGVLGIRALRPLPTEELQRCCGDAKIVTVLERTDTPLAADGPLAREVKLALAMHGTDQSRRSRSGAPRIVRVTYGIGGLPLNTADLAAMLDRIESTDQTRFALGMEFVRDSSSYPKHQALMDALRRSDETLASAGVRGDGPACDLRPDDAIAIAFQRRPGREHNSLARDTALTLHEMLGGHLRSRPGVTWERSAGSCIDTLTRADEPLRDPGDDVPLDIAVLVDGCDDHHSIASRLTEDAAVLVPLSAEARTPLSQTLHSALNSGQRRLYGVPLPRDDCHGSHEALVGAVTALVRERRGLEPLAEAEARTLREASLVEEDQPVRAARLDAFVSGTRSLQQLHPSDERIQSTASRVWRDRTSMARSEALARTWDHTAMFYEAGRTSEMTAHPDLAIGRVPPRSSTLRRSAGESDLLPVFDPAACDGDPRLWTTCPEGSVAPLVISSRALIDRGIELAGEGGRPADALRGVAGQLARRANKVFAAGDEPPTTAGTLLRQAFDDVAEKMKADAARLESLREAMDAVIDTVGALPIARTGVFFDEPEGRAPGTGELFSLLVDPDTCKCPELLRLQCEGHGLRFASRSEAATVEAGSLFDLWQRLPDTSGETIERARTHPDVGPLAAIMLSRHCLHAMAGGDGAEPGSGATLALRHVVGLSEFHLQPRCQRLLQEIDKLREQIDQRIHDVLAGALPTADLDALADGLSRLDDPNAGLAELTGKVDTAVSTGRIDNAHLSRLVDAARSVGRLRWRIAEGPTGLGRARSSIVMAPGGPASWTGVFPFNPFQAPVALDSSGESSAMAMGLLHGQLREVLDGFRLLRRARLELDDPSTAAQTPGAFADLTWRDLTADERAMCPPLLLVGDGRTLGGPNLGGVAWLLESGLPIKIIVLSGLGGALDNGLSADALDAYPSSERHDLALLALLNRDAFVAQTSIAERDHFATSILDAFAHDGPAFLHIHAPSPERHGFNIDGIFEQARLAIDARVLPLLRFDPAAEGVFGSRLDLSANPASASRWVLDENDEPITPAHWMVSEERFGDHLAPVGPDDAGCMPLDAYLDLPPEDRTGRTPCLTIGVGEASCQKRIAPAMIEDIESRLSFWCTLQELAGVVTPFTERVRTLAEQEVAEAHQAELAKLRREHEARIATLRDEFNAEATERVTQGLMALAGYDADGSMKS